VRAPGRPFWTAQVAGWGGYLLVLWLSGLVYLPEASYSALLETFHTKAVMAAGGFLTSLGLWAVYQRLLPERPRSGRILLVAVSSSLLLGLVWSVFASRLLWPGKPMWPYAFKSATNYGITLLAWSALYLAFTYRARLDEETERALRADALASQARLEMLRYQVNPHFLFNALNSIRALIEEDREKARQMVTELSEFFRYSLLHTRSGEIPLEAELDAIRSYLAIQKIRFEERLEVAWDVSPEASSARLPGFLVHPLVENAVKHGMETSTMPLRVGISARLSGPRLVVEVTNSGRLVPNGTCEGTGTGLANVRERLAHHFPGRHSFAIAQEGERVVARLEVEAGAA
jgi:anti-sigma regulatory factor (Ser/Thr protein kinase)